MMELEYVCMRRERRKLINCNFHLFEMTRLSLLTSDFCASATQGIPVRNATWQTLAGLSKVLTFLVFSWSEKKRKQSSLFCTKGVTRLD